MIFHCNYNNNHYFSNNFVYHEHRVTEIAQRQSPRGPPNPRTSSSDSDPQNTRPRNPKPTDGGRSIRSAQSDPSNPKKLGTRIANLESQLGLAQEELKSLKDQLVSTEPVKKPAQDQKIPIITYETSDEKETDVFEVLVKKLPDEPETELQTPEKPIVELEPENTLFDELALKNDEINSLKANLDEKAVEITSVRGEVDELTLRLTNISQELEKSKANAVEKDEKLEIAEKAKEELENEMRKLRVQSEQWRKAADAAASVLAGGVEINGRRLSERCGSMDKVYMNTFEHDGDDVFGGEKRKGSGIRMLGELWKKKGQK
ncbi:interactor of constitutive active rops 1 [Phtheirospermum japonicum]|uniref:Interactor of constitutive active rops 1 n=1 Tax=Phtheirospermum japonicum TaxID=374723 RepID=A0A830CKV2_9LAMI|nr:interactor of constitutive active rops 1 [Phtheirospermum japonicum]